MADRRNRRRGGILLLGVAGAAGAGVWVVWRRSGAGRPVRDEWARAVATPSPSKVGAPESVAVGSGGSVNGSAGVNGSGVNGSGVNGSAHNGRAPQGLLSMTEAPDAEKPGAEKPAVEKPAAEKRAAEKRAAEKRAAPKPPAKKPRAENPTDKPAAEAEIPDGPYGPGSAAPLPDGSAPGPEFTIKGNATSMLFHPPSSPYFGRTKPAAWFRTAEDAERAGFTEWKPKPRGA
jgi:hypothetical protein